MKKAGHPRPADLARAADSTTATISNWLNDHVSPAHVKAEQLFRIADAAKLDARELLYGVSGLGVGERGNTYIPSQAHLDVWQDAYELVSHLVEEKGWRSTIATRPWTCWPSNC
jgi:transcriptional regulator with XRE-family HTH domain